jgi:hypothetical protein
LVGVGVFVGVAEAVILGVEVTVRDGNSPSSTTTILGNADE